MFFSVRVLLFKQAELLLINNKYRIVMELSGNVLKSARIQLKRHKRFKISSVGGSDFFPTSSKSFSVSGLMVGFISLFSFHKASLNLSLLSSMYFFLEGFPSALNILLFFRSNTDDQMV